MPKAKTKVATSEANIYAIVGSDESEVKRVASELAAKLTPAEAGEFGLEVIDGCADNAEQAASKIRSAIEALQTLPFFGGRKLVWLKNLNFLADTLNGRPIGATIEEALEDLRGQLEAGLPPNVTLLISAAEVDKRRSFYKALGKHAELQVIDRLDSSRGGWEEEAVEIVRKRAKSRRLQFDEDALGLFVLLTGGDTRQIENELEKIDVYLEDERQVRIELVRDLVPISRNGIVFELGNALAAYDLERALSLIRKLLDQGEKPMGILLAGIVPTIRNLLLTKDLMERYRIPRPQYPASFVSALNRLPAEATEHLPRKKDGSVNGYALGYAALQAPRFEMRQLVAGLEACLEANRRIVTSDLDDELILAEVVVKLLTK